VTSALADVLDLLCGAVLRGPAGLSDAEALAVLAALFQVG
jgi:hypothetical protein